MRSFSGPVRTILAGMVAATFALGAPAAALALDPGFQTYETNTTELNALMAPIQPLVGGPDSRTVTGQSGTRNYATASIVGSGNLAIIGQGGDGNTAIQAIEGSNNALLLAQGGTNNQTLQVAKGDNDFQLLGVSGNSNSVAYVQVGDNLAGAMNVSGSNSAVLALQTPDSGHYMMPTGLTGLNNQLVVIVPGRMYVFNLNQN